MLCGIMDATPLTSEAAPAIALVRPYMSFVRDVVDARPRPGIGVASEVTRDVLLRRGRTARPGRGTATVFSLLPARLGPWGWLNPALDRVQARLLCRDRAWGAAGLSCRSRGAPVPPPTDCGRGPLSKDR